MPQIPRYQPSEAIAEAPNVHLENHAGPDPSGMLLAGRMAREAQEPVQLATHIATREMEYAENLAAESDDLELARAQQEILYNKDTGVTADPAMRGKGALNAPKYAQETWQREVERIGRSQMSGRRRENFLKNVANREFDMNRAVSVFVSGETQRFDDETDSESIDLEEKNAQRNWHDPVIVGRSLERIENRTQSYAARNGKPPEWTENRMRQSKNKIRLGVAAQMVDNGRLYEAQEYLADHAADIYDETGKKAIEKAIGEAYQQQYFENADALIEGADLNNYWDTLASLRESADAAADLKTVTPRQAHSDYEKARKTLNQNIISREVEIGGDDFLEFVLTEGASYFTENYEMTDDEAGRYFKEVQGALKEKTKGEYSPTKIGLLGELSLDDVNAMRRDPTSTFAIEEKNALAVLEDFDRFLESEDKLRLAGWTEADLAETYTRYQKRLAEVTKGSQDLSYGMEVLETGSNASLEPADKAKTDRAADFYVQQAIMDMAEETPNTRELITANLTKLMITQTTNAQHMPIPWQRLVRQLWASPNLADKERAARAYGGLFEAASEDMKPGTVQGGAEILDIYKILKLNGNIGKAIEQREKLKSKDIKPEQVFAEFEARDRQRVKDDKPTLFQAHFAEKYGKDAPSYIATEFDHDLKLQLLMEPTNTDESNADIAAAITAKTWQRNSAGVWERKGITSVKGKFAEDVFVADMARQKIITDQPNMGRASLHLEHIDHPELQETDPQRNEWFVYRKLFDEEGAEIARVHVLGPDGMPVRWYFDKHENTDYQGGQHLDPAETHRENEKLLKEADATLERIRSERRNPYFEFTNKMEHAYEGIALLEEGASQEAVRAAVTDRSPDYQIKLPDGPITRETLQAVIDEIAGPQRKAESLRGRMRSEAEGRVKARRAMKRRNKELIERYAERSY